MKKLLVVGLLLATFLLGACTSVAVISNADQVHPLKIWAENTNGAYHTFKVVDDITGVNYVVVSFKDAGYHDATIAITPRLNADGTPYTSK